MEVSGREVSRGLAAGYDRSTEPAARWLGLAQLDFDLQRFADEEERTEPATPKRRQEAREKGQVAKSVDLGTALVLLASAGVLYFTGGWLVAGVRETMVAAFSGSWLSGDFTVSTVAQLFQNLTWRVALLVMPVSLAAAAVGLLAQLVQVGFLFTGYPLQPQLERINPLAGLRRIFSRRALVELLKALLKVLVIGGIAYRYLRGSFDFLPRLVSVAPAGAGIWMGQTAWRTTLAIGAALLVVGVLDYLYQRVEYERSLRMSRKQLLEELKQTEGDPLIRRRLRERQRQMASRRMMQAVPTADVVITNPTHLAVALKYDMATMEAPVVVAKGAGIIAQRIREVAEKHGVVVLQDRWLARALYEGVEIGQAIPEHLYQAVARVLAFVYRLRRRSIPRQGEGDAL